MMGALFGSKATEKLSEMGLFGNKRKEVPAILAETDFNRRTNELKRANNTKVKAQSTSARTLPETEVRVRGTVYCKPNLSSAKRTRLSLTRKNDYQIQHGWPEGDIINVNELGSRETNADNFIGYINAKDAMDLYMLVQKSGRCDVFARIERSVNGPQVTLLLPA